MSEFMFGVGRTPISRATAKKVYAIAREHGFHFTSGCFPGDGYMHWFSGPNRGNPFDQACERAIMADVAKAGLLDAEGRILPKKR
jgi:hypothetical protein